jgi:solute carrier family 25, member 33/36
MVGEQKRKYEGLFRVFVTVVREEGISRLYGGLTPHLIKSVPAAMVYFTVYETMLGYAGIET